ncbi:AAA family ATPase [Vibrio parahaemolyticus]|nr:AAA family ATPase [Vibrio parahaemolyticus]
MKLIDKYAPTTIDELVLPEAAHKVISKCLENNQGMNNLIFFSELNGTGKTSAARMLAKKWSRSALGNFTDHDEPIYEFKGSQFGTSDVTELRSVLSMAGERVIVINEVDNLSSKALDNLSETLDEYTSSNSNTFIFTTNNYEELPKIIKSRCQLVDFTPVDTQDKIVERLCHIFKEEKGEPTERDIKVIKDIVENQKGSIRQSIIKLGEYIDTDDYVLEELDDVEKLIKKQKYHEEQMRLFEERVARAKEKQKTTCFDSALDAIKNYEVEQFIEYLIEKGMYSPKSKEKKEKKSKAKRESKTDGNYYYFKDESGEEHLLTTMAGTTIKVTEPWRTLVEDTVIENGNHVSGIQDHLIRFVKEEGGNYTFWTDATLGGAKEPNDKGAIETKFKGLSVKTIESIKRDIAKPESEAA